MLKRLFAAIGILLVTGICNATNDFTSVDSLLNANLAGPFHNKLICMVMHNDSLVYYYHQGGDSTTLGGIASCSKTLSAAVMLRLVQEGTIRLDDSIAHYYPYTTSIGKGGITLRQLFAHTSGLQGNTDYNSDASITLQQSADSILTVEPLIYGPSGTKFRYTGEDQQVAGAAAELAAGISWDSLFSSKLARPLGLNNTSFYITTPSNPRVAGGIRTSAADMLRFGQFVLHNGKSAQGVQVVDSVLMQELWKDQTNHALQISSPAPFHPVNNNPYNADTMFYGLGSWLDIYNPTQQYQEQISADGAFGGLLWINRCTNTVGMFLTFLPSLYPNTYTTEYAAMDIFRNSFPFTCYSIATGINEQEDETTSFKLYPNPAQQSFTVELPSGTFKIQVADLTGRIMLEEKALSNTTHINCNNLLNGVYLVQAVNDKHIVATKKIVIAR